MKNYSDHYMLVADLQLKRMVQRQNESTKSFTINSFNITLQL
jgi:hypothetical protein